MATNTDGNFSPSAPHKSLHQSKSVPADMSEQWYDFCMWYHKDDEDTAKRIYRELERQDYVGFIENRDFKVDDVFKNIQDGIDHSSKILVLLSQSSLNCSWFEKKVHTSLVKSLDDPQRRDCVIPIFDRIGKNDVPSSLRTLTGVDFGNMHFLNRLKQSLGPPTNGQHSTALKGS